MLLNNFMHLGRESTPMPLMGPIWSDDMVGPGRSVDTYVYIRIRGQPLMSGAEVSRMHVYGYIASTSSRSNGLFYRARVLWYVSDP